MKYKNIFVLSTGRCGSMSFYKACSLIENYTAGHETKSRDMFSERLNYPAHHIEIDNRLIWFHGQLENQYPDAFYIHLIRKRDHTSKSLFNRSLFSNSDLLSGFMTLLNSKKKLRRLNDASLYLYDTVNTNIESFLKYKPHMRIDIERIKEVFPIFCKRIDAKVNIDEALKVISQKSNATKIFKKIA